MAQIIKKYIADNAIDESKLRLNNDGALKSRNAADSGDVEILKVDSSDNIVFSSVPRTNSDAVDGNELVRKSQLDANLQGLKPKEAVRAGSTASLALSGGAVLTIDNVTMVNGDRVLLKDQTDATENGIYDVSGIGSAYALTRSSDFDETTPINEVQGAYVAIQEGDQNAGKVYVQTGVVTTIGSDDIDFIFFNSNTGLTGGDGIVISGSSISVDQDGEGLTFVTGQLALELADGTLSKSASGLQIGTIDVVTNITNGTITGDKLAPAIAGNGLAFNANALDVQVDDASIEISTDTLQIKDAGVTAAKLNTGDTNGDATAVGAETLSLSSAYAPTTGSVTGGDSVESAIEKLDDAIQNISVPLPALETLTLSGSDVSNGFVDLATTAVSFLELTPQGGPTQIQTIDYTVSLAGGAGGVTRVSFSVELQGILEAGDVVQIRYIA